MKNEQDTAELEQADTEQPEQSQPDTDTTETAEAVEGEDALGDPGKRALAAMKAQLKAEKERRKALEAELAQKTTGQDTDDKAALEAELLSKFSRKNLKAELKAAAKGRLARPDDILRYVELDEFQADADGDFDEATILAAVDEVLQDRPYLAAQSGKQWPKNDAGAARKPAGPSQLTQADLATMTPEQINKARLDGRLDALMGIK